MIGEPSQIWLAVVPVDMRRGIDGLSAVVQEALGQAPCSGMAFVFRNKVGNRLRLLVWDGNGVWLCHRRLHLAEGGRCQLLPQPGAMGLVGVGGGLAEAVAFA